MNNIYFFIQEDELYNINTTNEILCHNSNLSTNIPELNYDEIKQQIINKQLETLQNTDDYDYLEKYQLLCDEYFNNYTVKYLKIIADYYNIKLSNKHRKNDIIDLIVSFELNPKNLNIVNKRLTMWNYINILKNDKCFKHFIRF